MKIFYAEDDKDDLEFFKEALDAIDPELSLVHLSDGRELLERLSDASKLPDIVFLDINMPSKNGYECLEELRAKQHTQNLPVIIFSTSSSPEIIQSMQERGATGYIVKPDDFRDWQVVIKRALNRIFSRNHDEQMNFLIS